MTESIRPVDTSLFDESTPASDDFYRHVNGGWLDKNPVPAEYGSWGAFHEVNERNQELLHGLLKEAAEREQPAGTPARMVGDYYASAMDEAGIAEAGIEPLRPLLDTIDAATDVADVRAIARDMHHIGGDPLHSIGISPDFEDSNAYMVYVGQGGLGLPERDYYTRDDERSVALREAYVAHVAHQLGNLGYDENAADAAAAAILAFETRLAEASYNAETMRDVQLTMNRYAVESLDELMPTFGLSGYVRELGAALPSVNVDNPGFFTALEALLLETPIETVRDYLRWQLIASYASSLPKEFEQEAFEFYGKTLGGQQAQRPRWKRALDAATGDIGEQVAQLYVDAAFSEEAKTRCEHLVDNLLAAMGDAIRGAEWMSDATKEQAVAKLAGFTYKIGYPDEWRDYSALEIDRGPWVANRMRAAAFEYDREFGRLGEPVDTTEWAMPAHMVNAYYHPLLNEIVFPAGILQPPFFYANADDAVNYGAIGAVIGHEITHGFDDRGSQFDEKGALRNWWTEDDRAEFERRAKVLIDQFDAYEVAEDVRVNGRLTLGENIADLGGVSVSFAALGKALAELPEAPEPIDGFTPQQRFFLSYAAVWRMNYTDEYIRLLVNVDPHSPTHFRTNGPLSNFKPFATAFGVAEGSSMARPAADRARIW